MSGPARARPRATLVTISFSHYCEKARWGLDRAGIAYVEEPHAPLVHWLGTLPRGGRSTPTLALPGAASLTDSTDILQHVESLRPGSLWPSDPTERAEVEALEARFGAELGPATRRLAYHAIFTGGESLAPLLRLSTTGISRAAATPLSWLIPPALSRALRIDAHGAELSRQRMAPILADVERRLADGRPFLVGDRFTAADLTFAALYAPLLWPPEHPVTGRQPLPRGLERLRDEARSRPAGAFAMRLYRDERARRPFA